MGHSSSIPPARQFDIKIQIILLFWCHLRRVVIPAKVILLVDWIPAFAGMTNVLKRTADIIDMQPGRDQRGWTDSYAPMSGGVFRGFPSISSAGASSLVPAPMHGLSSLKR